MKNFKLTVNNVKYFIQEVYRILKSQGEFCVNISEWSDDRSLPASAQIQVWYQQIAERTFNDKKSVECRMKIDFGIPILLADIDKGGYPVVLKYILDKTGLYNMSFEQQEKLISGIAITREMKTKQHNKYREQLQAYWAQHDIHLEYKGKRK